MTRLSTDSKAGPWRIVEHVSLARCRTTYRVTHVETQQCAALDVYDAPPRPFGSYTDRLRTVMHAINRVGHPGAVAIFDVGTLPDGRPYVVREFIDGLALGSCMSLSPLSITEAVELCVAICDVLAAAHAAGVVHRSLDLDNVILVGRVAKSLVVKLLDWGIGDEVLRAAKPGTNTPPPPAAAAADVYALGVLMHRLLARVPLALESLWTTMLAPDPGARPSIADVASQLRAIDCASDQEVSAVPRRPLADAARPRRSGPRTTGSMRVPPLERAKQPGPTRHATPPPPPVLQSEPAAIVSAGEPATESAHAAPISVVERPTARHVMPGPHVQPGAWRVAIGTGAAIVAAFAMFVVSGTLRTARLATASAGEARVATHVAHERTRPLPAAKVVLEPAPSSALDDTSDADAEAGPAQPSVTLASALRPDAAAVEQPVVANARAAHGISTGKRARASRSPTTTVLEGEERAALVAQYRRVGGRLLRLERVFGAAVTEPVAARFKWIKLDAALATSTSRRLVAATLRELDSKLDGVRAEVCATSLGAKVCP